MHRRKITLAIAFVGFVIFGGLAAKQTLFNREAYVERYTDGRVIPAGGLLVNPNGLSGLSNDTEGDFRKLYRAIDAYVTAKGTLPDDPRSLIPFTQDWPVGRRITEEALYTPDYRKSDVYSPKDEKFNYLWAYRSPRADGTAKPPRPPSGERDVWLYTETYVRERKRVFRDGSSVTHPKGRYVVLWSDGTVEKVGFDRLVTAPSGASGEAYFFKGEAGSVKAMHPSTAGEAKRGKWWPEPNQNQRPDLSTG